MCSARTALILALLVGLASPSVGQSAPVPAVDTLTSSLLPDASIVRREVPNSCFDCWSAYHTVFRIRGVELEVRGLEDLPVLWSLLPALSESAQPTAFRERVLTLLALTFLPDERPRLLRDSMDIDPFLRPLVASIVISPPEDSGEFASQSTTFIVSTSHGLHRIYASVASGRDLKVSEVSLACYLCP